MCPSLTDAPLHTSLSVTRVCLSDVLVMRLAALGVTVGALVELLSRHAGAVVLLVRGSRVALDSEVASQVFVEEKGL